MTDPSGVINEPIESALETMANFALRSLRERAPNGHFPTVEEHVIEFSDDGSSVSLGTVSHPISSALIERDTIAVLMKDPLFSAAVRRIWDAGWAPLPQMSDAAGKPIEPTFENSSLHTAEFVFGLVCRFVDERRTLDLPRNELVRFLVAQRVTWASPTITDEAIIPLLQFRTEVSPVELGDGALLASLTGSEKSELWSPFGDSFGQLSTGELRSAHGKLAKRGERSRSQPAHVVTDLPQIAWCAITALRLLKAGPVGARVHHVREIWPVQNGSASSNTLTEFLLPEHSWGEYVLRTGEINSFLRVHQILRALQGRSVFDSLALCLRRFNLSYSRDHLDDRVIDLVIGLEGTLLFGESQELRNKLATRGATLLRRIRAPVNTFADLKRLYDVRSKIVHSGQTLEELLREGDLRLGAAGRGVNDYVRDVEQLLRDVLLSYLELLAGGQSMAAVTEGLDSDLLTGLGKL